MYVVCFIVLVNCSLNYAFVTCSDGDCFVGECYRLYIVLFCVRVGHMLSNPCMVSIVYVYFGYGSGIPSRSTFCFVVGGKLFQSIVSKSLGSCLLLVYSVSDFDILSDIQATINLYILRILPFGLLVFKMMLVSVVFEVCMRVGIFSFF